MEVLKNPVSASVRLVAHLIVHYGHSAAEADALVAGIRAAGGSADAAQADFSTSEGAAALAKQVRAIIGQRLDIFVSNAGVSKAAAIDDHTIEDIRGEQVIEVSDAASGGHQSC